MKKYRGVDVAWFKRNGEVMRLFQVGKATKKSIPYKRELEAIYDILTSEKYKEIGCPTIEFVPYNIKVSKSLEYNLNSINELKRILKKQ